MLNLDKICVDIAEIVKKTTVTINVDEQKKGGDIKQFQIDEQSN